MPSKEILELFDEIQGEPYYEEMHEHPLFNGQYHVAVWVKTWSSGGTNDEPPDVPLTCAICGKMRGA